jgi:transcriptional regulator with XRE-family HTH domain
LAKESEAQIRAALLKLRETVPLRELAARAGVSHYTLGKFIRGKRVFPSTKERIRRWLEEPGPEDAVERIRTDLKALLGRVGARRSQVVEVALARLIASAFEEAGEEVPRWVAQFGRKQA